MGVNFNYMWREPLSPSEINLLFKTVEWPQFSEEQLQQSFQSTWNWITCRSSDGQLVGFSRILSDGITHAYICSMVVHASFQKSGIGTAMMLKMLDLCSDSNLKPVLKTKVEGEILHFYNKFGFKTEKDGACALVF
jgi:ribosomal protein S18 acetylase RimI-like enzyme